MTTKPQGETPRTKELWDRWEKYGEDEEIEGSVDVPDALTLAAELERALSECREELESYAQPQPVPEPLPMSLRHDAAKAWDERLAAHAEREGTAKWRCVSCGEWFDEERFSHTVAVDDGHGNPVPQQCGPINPAPSPADGLAEEIERQRDALLEMPEDRGDAEYHFMKLCMENSDKIIAALRSRQAPRGEEK